MSQSTTYIRRYYLHRRLKKYFRVNAAERRVDVTEAKIDQLPDLYKNYLEELRKQGYSIQYSIL